MKKFLVIINGGAKKKMVETPYKVNLAKVVGQWVEGKYKTTVETLGGGMSDDPLLKQWCKTKNKEEGGIKNQINTTFMLLTDELVEGIKEQGK